MREWLKLQKFNLLFFSALACALGMGLYFSISHEPNLFYLITISVIGFVSLFFTKRYKILIPVIFGIIGFGYAGIYTHIKTVKPLTHSVHNIELNGVVKNIDYATDKTRLFLQTDAYGLVRVSCKDAPAINIGDTVIGHGGLFKPSPAPMPETFDMARHAYFNNLSGTGYISDIKITEQSRQNNVSILRDNIHKSANSFLTDTLILGYKNSLNKSHRAVWATNGVAHIWSISGYHMALIGGWFFALFYLIFRSCPYLVRRVPARIPALICAGVVLAGYLLISGGGVATIRAFIMTILVMVAFIFGRNVISLRTASIAFALLILINPYYVMQAGFQLSFAAIFGILWVWSDVKPKMPTNKILKYTYAGTITAIVATCFTAPFIIAHFNSLPIYSILSNIIMVPLFSIIIMPLVVLGTICATLGLHGPLHLAHYIYDIMFKYATTVSALPQANMTLGNISNIALIIIIFGFVFLVFIRNNDKFKSVILRHTNILLAYVFILIGIVVWQSVPRPIFYISSDHNLIAFVQDEKLFFNKDRDSGNYFAFDTWKKSNGENPDLPTRKKKSDHGVHTITNQNWTLSYIQRFVPLANNIEHLCKSDEIDFIAAYYDITSTYCNHKIIRGGAVIYPDGTVRHVISNRWWHNRPE